MYPGAHALDRPDHPAVIMAGDGRMLTNRELDERSNRFANLCRNAGLQTGDRVAILAENVPEYFEVLWGAIRTGLYLTTVNRYLTPREVTHIVADSGAKVLVTTAALADVAEAAVDAIPDCAVRLCVGEATGSFADYRTALDEHPATPNEENVRGDILLYSSGTTGLPKGIKRPLNGERVDEPFRQAQALNLIFGFDAHTMMLSPAPLYHTAPLATCWAVQALGGCVVVMEDFDAEPTLAVIDQHKVTHSQMVPTMYLRLLDLPDEVKARYDLSTHRCSVHTAAPCPVEAKQRLMDWWGPIVHEIYGGTEGNGNTYVDPQDWLDHPGTVGRAVSGTIRICDDGGRILGPGEIGTVYFEQDRRMFEYHDDPEKTRKAQHPDHPTWSTLGDVGHLDESGFLYLTDRKAFTIISGGVNVYPREIEDVLILHPDVADVAVVGVPHHDLGEQVKAVVQPRAGVDANAELVDELLAYARRHLGRHKVPRSIDFDSTLPRLPTGKLYKEKVKARYW